ncbi:MAG TPA: imidazoleglycerol-phosphate dehydratase HisB [Rhodospirillaceae bacterium]|jgi:imidazoleglycerol-phosphate dehydratase|nr:imidazoleglycerol-phosphate dehydratase HisB [Alphaproteobacteria bacterium]HBH26236.1 imidazoleglycerol-phosphate dehydratase HisB [Rhodospirillaceae bacterium]
MTAPRTATVHRATKETDITVTLDLDGQGRAEVATGIGFFDHMLEQLARHGLMNLTVQAKGDLHIDGHHTVEDTGLALGQALREALGERRGITRYGWALVPMDEALARVAVDLSGRPGLTWDVPLARERLGGMDTELFREFFGGFVQAGGLSLHAASLYGTNDHHRVEGVFKAAARALRAAVAPDPRAAGAVPSTKGVL